MEQLGASFKKHPYLWIAGGIAVAIVLLYFFLSGSSSSSASSGDSSYLSSYYNAEAQAADSNNQLQALYDQLQAASLATTTNGGVNTAQISATQESTDAQTTANENVNLASIAAQSSALEAEASDALQLGTVQSNDALAAVQSTNAATVGIDANYASTSIQALQDSQTNEGTVALDTTRDTYQYVQGLVNSGATPSEINTYIKANAQLTPALYSASSAG